MWSCKVFPLQQCLRKLLLHCLNELIYEIEIGLAGNPFMTPADVLRVLESLGVVGAHIQDDRQRSLWMNTTNAGVEGELANRDAEPACALITDAQNALAVGYNDYIDIFVGAIPQQLRDRVTQR